MYILFDANVVAAYYLPRSTQSSKVAERAQILIDSVRSGASRHFFYIPNFCIAEVFSVFMKYAFGTWNKQVKRAKGPIDKRVYKSLKDQFHEDIHNGKLFYHYELSRYHVLGINVVAPIDHHYKITKGPDTIPMGTFDHLIISMSIHLAHIHGSENVLIVSADDRLTDILARCRSDISKEIIKKLKLEESKEITGRDFNSRIFPRFINFKRARKKDLENIFGSWPLSINRHKKAYRYL